MVITRLQKKGKKVEVWLNDEPAFSLYPKEISEYHLKEDDVLPEETRQKIFQNVLTKRARLRCLYILKSQDRTRAQLQRKLKEDGYPDEIIEDALSYAESYHYIDDLRFAVSYTQNRKETKSRRQIRTDLLARGVSAEEIEEAFRQVLGEEDQRQALLYWMEKKHFCPESADEAQTGKFIRFLTGKGFTYEDIRKWCL